MRPALLSLLSLLALLAAAAPAEARRSFCDNRPGYTLVSDGSWRVFETIIPVKGDPDADVTTVKVCQSGTRKPNRRLERYRNTLDGALRPTSAQIRGRWLLMDVYEETGVTAGHALRLFKLGARPKRLSSVYAEGSDAFDYALTDSGAFAAFIPFPGGIVGFDATGQHPLAGEAAGDLAAAGSRVYWTENDVSASAVLGAAPTRDFEFQ